jgi:hypothetical protein
MYEAVQCLHAPCIHGVADLAEGRDKGFSLCLGEAVGLEVPQHLERVKRRAVQSARQGTDPRTTCGMDTHMTRAPHRRR